MNLFSLIMALLLAALLLTLLIWGYLRLYTQRINRRLRDAQAGRTHLPEPRYMLKLAMALLLIMALVLTSAALPSLQRLRNAADIERDARKMGSVSEDWLAEVAVHEDIAGVLLFAPDLSDAKFAVYLNRGKWGNYYCFSHGGSSASVRNGLHSFSYQDGEILFSMNKLGIARIVCDDGISYDVVPGQPFALALSTDRFSFYDAAGCEIDPHQVPLFEQTDKDK
ncbi:MAG: hypothetical protein IKM70_05240 [Firmicutes bacterium]|nr:hypothetical protein [Bacillota bacterium]